jgi:site-specific DNA-cytosine methylase
VTFGSLFAGIGGFDLGFHRAGWECREIDQRLEVEA